MAHSHCRPAVRRDTNIREIINTPAGTVVVYAQYFYCPCVSYAFSSYAVALSPAAAAAAADDDDDDDGASSVISATWRPAQQQNKSLPRVCFTTSCLSEHSR